MHDSLSTAPASLRFLPEATQKLTSLKDGFTKEIKDAIQHGSVPPKSKKIDVLQPVAASLHMFNQVHGVLIQAQKPYVPPQEISLDTLKRESSLWIKQISKNKLFWM